MNNHPKKDIRNEKTTKKKWKKKRKPWDKIRIAKNQAVFNSVKDIKAKNKKENM